MSSWSKFSGPRAAQRGDWSISVPTVDVDELWQGIERTTSGLQASGRLPSTSRLYHTRMDAVRDYLRSPSTGRASNALRVAREIARGNPGAGFVALELIKAFHLAYNDSAGADRIAKEQERLLRAAEKDVQKEREQRRY